MEVREICLNFFFYFFYYQRYRVIRTCAPRRPSAVRFCRVICHRPVNVNRRLQTGEPIAACRSKNLKLTSSVTAHRPQSNVGEFANEYSTLKTTLLSPIRPRVLKQRRSRSLRL